MNQNRGTRRTGKPPVRKNDVFVRKRKIKEETYIK